MNDLVKRELWDVRHVRSQACTPARWLPSSWLREKIWRGRANIGADHSQSYSDYLFVRLPMRYLPARSDWSAIEVGCAPGGNLLMLNRRFGYRVCGVEYSHVGAARTREFLLSHGLSSDVVVEADFFDRSFHDEYNNRFDVVLPRGFLEHFEFPNKAVEEHVALLRNDGYLVCSIPNLLGISYPYLSVLGRDLLRAHNTRIMCISAFRALFENQRLNPLFCGYCGQFQLFGMSTRCERSVRGIVGRGLDRLEGFVDHLLFLMLRGAALETRLSPHLVFVGQRHD